MNGLEVIFEWLGFPEFCIWGRTLYHEDRLQKDRLNLPELTQDGNHRSCESGLTKGRVREVGQSLLRYKAQTPSKCCWFLSF